MPPDKLSPYYQLLLAVDDLISMAHNARLHGKYEQAKEYIAEIRGVDKSIRLLSIEFPVQFMNSDMAISEIHKKLVQYYKSPMHQN